MAIVPRIVITNEAITAEIDLKELLYGQNGSEEREWTLEIPINREMGSATAEERTLTSHRGRSSRRSSARTIRMPGNGMSRSGDQSCLKWPDLGPETSPVSIRSGQPAQTPVFRAFGNGVFLRRNS